MSATRRTVRRYVPKAVVRAVRTARSRAGEAVGATQPDAPRGGREPLVTALRQGRPLSEALVAEVRSLVRRGDHAGATAIAAALRDDPSTEELGRLCSGLVAFHRDWTRLAWDELSRTSRDSWSRHAAAEYARAGVAHGLDDALREIEGLLEEPPAHMNAKRWMDVLEPVYGAGAFELAGRLAEALDARLATQDNVDERVTLRRDWIRRWIDRTPTAPVAPPTGADVSFAVMDYDHPGRSRASANIGDHVQTIASLGHLLRHTDASLQGRQELVDLLTQLRSRVRPEMQRRGTPSTVQVLTVDRDASAYNEVPENTWTLAFGWYMHALFGDRFGFPFHPQLQPIFVSFHCNKRGLLTPEAIEYLRAHGPIGCRDWTTVDILLSVDVPAFFSGCLTTTINTVFPDAPEAFPAGAPVAYVDVKEPPAGAETYRHSDDAVRFRSFEGNMYEAVELLETYRRRHSAVVTSRLHCYLPVRSLGGQVDFQPHNRSDIRFAGLIDIDDDAFHAIQDGINRRLEDVFGLILSGAGRDEVYARWRELCAPDVRRAEQRRAEAQAVPDASEHPGSRTAVERAVATTRSHGDTAAGADGTDGAVDVAVVVDEHRPQVLNVLVDSLTTSSSVPLRLWLLNGSGKRLDLDEVARRAGGAAVHEVLTHDLGSDLRGLSRRTHGLELVMLPGLLPQVDRVVVLPLAAVVDGDVAELAATDLAGHAIAAPDVSGRPGASGFGVIHLAGNRLGARTAVAVELRRRTHAMHTFDFTAFDTDVLVADLARLRQEGAVAAGARLVEEFGLTAHETLHVLVGPHRAPLPSRWHVVPSRDGEDAPALLHWLDEPRPWGDDYAPAQARWVLARRAMRQRLAGQG